jgi:hypothetical protein
VLPAVVSEPADALLAEVVQRVQGVVGGGMKLQLRDGSEKVCSAGEATEVPVPLRFPPTFPVDPPRSPFSVGVAVVTIKSAARRFG